MNANIKIKESLADDKIKTNEQSSAESNLKERERLAKISLPKFTISQLMEAGVHYGHRKNRWNPEMEPFIYGERNGIYIIDLQKTYSLLNRALKTLYEVSSKNGRVLFVCTRKQFQDVIKDAAISCGQYYVNHRWLGGMLTNWSTVSNSIHRLKKLESFLSKDNLNLKKKELLTLTRKRDKLDLTLGGIRNMAVQPDLIFVIDTRTESLAVEEAKKLNIPIIAVLDSNSSPRGIKYPIPGNDDAIKSVKLYCHLISNTIINGMKAGVSASNRSDNKSSKKAFNHRDKGKFSNDKSKFAKSNVNDNSKKQNNITVKKPSEKFDINDNKLKDEKDKKENT